MQSPVSPVTAYAYPLESAIKGNQSHESSFDNSLLLAGSNDSVEMGENFFTQLDSMIAAVKVESNALFSVKEKLQEMDVLRDQLVAVNKRMVEQEQTNLNLKQALIQEQQIISDLRKQKAEADAQVMALRQELNRTKDALTKERNSKTAQQQEVAILREQLSKLEKINETLDRDAKALPGLMESNEIMKNDLQTLRARYKDEKQQLQQSVKQLQSQLGDVEALRGEVRALGMRLVDIGSNSSTSMNAARYNSVHVSPAKSVYDNYGAGSAGAGGGGGGGGMYAPQPTHHHTHMQEEDEDDYEDDDEQYEEESVHSQLTTGNTHHSQYYGGDGGDGQSVNSHGQGMSKVRQNLTRNVYGYGDHTQPYAQHASAAPIPYGQPYNAQSSHVQSSHNPPNTMATRPGNSMNALKKGKKKRITRSMGNL